MRRISQATQMRVPRKTPGEPQRLLRGGGDGGRRGSAGGRGGGTDGGMDGQRDRRRVGQRDDGQTD